MSGARSLVLERLHKRSLAVGAVFLLALGAGFLLDRAQFFRSYLLGFLFWTEIAVGALGLGMLSHLTGGLWGVVPRRFHEAAARTFPALALGFVPIALGAPSLYLWARPEVVAEDALLQAKAPYLNLQFFVVRAVLSTAGYDVIEGSTGEDALRRLIAHRGRRAPEQEPRRHDD